MNKTEQDIKNTIAGDIYIKYYSEDEIDKAIWEQTDKKIIIETINKTYLLVKSEAQTDLKKKVEMLEKNILNKRRYLPSPDYGGTMVYFEGNYPSNRGIYVDLGAIMGEIKEIFGDDLKEGGK